MGKTRVKISFLFFAMVTMILTMDEKLVALIAVMSVALHEMGHIVAMAVLKNSPDEIAFGIFGVRIKQSVRILSCRQEFFVVFCGPLMNIVLFTVFLLLYLACEQYIFLVIFAVNFAVGMFNLLPVALLDGGRMMRIMLMRFLTEEKTRTIMLCAGVSITLVILICGAALFIKTGANASLFVTGLYLLIMCVRSIKI